MSSGYCTKLGTEHCSIIRIVLCGTTFTLLKKRCQCFVDAPMLRSHRRQRPLTDNKEKPQPHWTASQYFLIVDHMCAKFGANRPSRLVPFPEFMLRLVRLFAAVRADSRKNTPKTNMYTSKIIIPARTCRHQRH